MTVNQKIWYISAVVLAVCLLAALIIYYYTGHIFLAILIAPPLIHYALKYRNQRLE